MLSQMPTYCRKNHQDDDVLDHPVSQWPQDEIEILNGNCSFRVDYLGTVEVPNPTSSKSCRESFAKLYMDYKSENCRFNSAVLWITGYELRVVEQESKNLISAQIVENILFCASASDSQLFYTCRDTHYDRWLCHLLIVKNCPSDRPCKAVGLAFRMCVKRKSIREGHATTTAMTTINTRSLG